MHGAITGTAFERADVEAAVEAARAAQDEAMRAFEGRGRDAGGRERARAVSYTHLTLPTIYSV